MSLKGFHPIVSQWFFDTFENPTDVQLKAWPHIQSAQNTLIAAPTGSGKTLAAFLVLLDRLFIDGLANGTLAHETSVVYVSPLKALSTDIHVNLSLPREGIQRLAAESGLNVPPVTTGIRTGDTSASRRAAMIRRPPHILVTTPESLYLLLTARKSRAALANVRTVIVDEIHAVLPSRRGAHLALSLERLNHVTQHPLQRIGLSATQRPVETVAKFLTGGNAPCSIVDLGHQRPLDMALELPKSPLDAVMAHEVWAEIYDRISELSIEHETTLVFTGTRHLAERMARHLGTRIGNELVMAHHGSLAQDRRHDAEQKLKAGKLKVLVATASLELGIDIGSVELVCQIGSPRRIATFLQRIGRAGHHIGGVAKGRLFPITRDDLVECAALLDAVRRGELEHVHSLDAPLDVLAQQIVAECAAQEWSADDLSAIFRCAWPYRNLSQATFESIVTMCARGFDTSHGRRGALIHYDRINRRIRGRRAARITALTSGGAIPDTADYKVVLEPSGHTVGSVFEDFAIESFAGDVFQLGNAAWRILQVTTGVVRVEDATGATPTLPFWRSASYARSDELSGAVSRLRQLAEPNLGTRESATEWFRSTLQLQVAAAVQLAEYLCASYDILDRMPHQGAVLAERFFDDSGGMQLVLHTPFGARVNRAWGLALRKKFCRTFNFELQAAATENCVLLSLGPQHSFPLADVFAFLSPEAARITLEQAIIDSPMFQTRWRWNLNIALAVPRARGGRKVAPQLQRIQADDVLVSVFPEAAACLENIVGERTIPDHPLINQTLADCWDEDMDGPHLVKILRAIRDESIKVYAIDTPEPSTLAHEVLAANPYAFLDDAPLEERRAHLVYSRRAFEPGASHGMGLLDRPALERTLREVQPLIRDENELHDALLTAGWMAASSGSDISSWFESLVRDGRATTGKIRGTSRLLWLPTERLHDALALWDLTLDPKLKPLYAIGDKQDVAVQFALGQLEVSGPISTEGLASRLHVDETVAERALLTLESQGAVLRGIFTADANGERQWCHRRLLARVHRYTVTRMRSEISPVSQSDYMRFLFAWQKAAPNYRMRGENGLWSVIQQLNGYALQAAAWETEVLPARVADYSPEMLDRLCMAGYVGWRRQAGYSTSGAGSLRTTPVMLILQEQAALFGVPEVPIDVSAAGRKVWQALAEHGPAFIPAIAAATGLLPTQVEAALAELVKYGRITSDGFGGLRLLLTPVDKRRPEQKRAPRFDAIGRWTVVPDLDQPENAALRIARILLKRYGIVCRRVLTRESGMPPWRDLVRAYWDLELRGDVRGGRFIEGIPGEQFGLQEAVALARRVRRESEIGSGTIGLSAADPLNLAGIIGPGARLPAVATNRLVYSKGEVVATLRGGAAEGDLTSPTVRRLLHTQCAVARPLLAA